MIEKFDSMFAGHVDMGNIGYGGTTVNDRRFPNEHLVTVFDKAEAIARLMDSLGYDTFWMAEHHFQPEGYECIPNILMLSTHLAHLTQNIRLGCAFNIAPMWHPLRLAEDFATADVLTGGRVVFGVGRGYHTREVDTFGAPLLNQEANRDLFEEQVEVILRAFDEETFSHHGKYYDLPPRVSYRGYELEHLTLVPRPLHRPVECWQPIQSATVRGMDFMAKHLIKGTIGSGVAEGGALDSVVHAYRDALVRAGRDAELGEDLCIGQHFFIADTEEQAMKEAAPLFEENLKMFGPLRLTRGLSEEQIRDIADPTRAPNAGLPTIQEAVKNGAFLCGPPERIVEKLMDLGERYPGLRRVTVSQPVGAPLSMIEGQLERFAKEVMPAFRNQPVAPAS
jgi:alkanesulfonate monooxygenase SsuD/methylene tetrahydromethanopterin reductase-like flavin-dependent oxidoreductase (luciferase family)